ncbi:MAG: ATP synthase F1 subunit gamma [Methylococcaceae bacterium]|nr:ATP synthase F1 subunit gamma [Methylococcaceae bacterium]
MPSTRDIRRRIKSVKNTAQITKAMQMVASSKMQKAQQSALQGRAFAKMANDLIAHLTTETRDYSHPLMEVREVRKRAVVLIGTDKGLCGALNSNLFRDAAKYDPATTQFIAVGRKAAQFLARAKRKLVAEFLYHDTPTYSECQAISKFAQDHFLKGEVDTVDVLYTRFINTLSQRPDVRPLLPMASVEAMKAEAAEKAEERESFDFLFEPDASTVLERLMLYLVDFRIAQLLLEAKASEHSARMVAMKSATDNANQLIKDLTLEYNKLRQASITKELLEISSAQMALG